MVKFTVALFVLLALFSCFLHVCYAVDQAEVEETLVKAESELISAYTSVAEAEIAGANVSELLVRLDLAGSLLAEAKNSCRIGDYEGAAYLLAVNFSDVVSGVLDYASDLKSEAEEAYSRELLFNVGISSVGLSFLFVLSLFGWRFLKKAYLRRALGMKPEVEDEAN